MFYSGRDCQNCTITVAVFVPISYRRSRFLTFFPKSPVSISPKAEEWSVDSAKMRCILRGERRKGRASFHLR